MRRRRIGWAWAKWACSALAVLVLAVALASPWYSAEMTLYARAGPGEDRAPVWLLAGLHRWGIVIFVFSRPPIFPYHQEWFIVHKPSPAPDWVWAFRILRRGSNTVVFVPLWIPLCALAAPAGLLWYAGARSARRRRTGLCRSCRYDRRGLAQDARCPECGAAPTPATKPPGPALRPAS